MSLIFRGVQQRNLLQFARVLNTLQAKQCHWMPDFKPGPYPKTKEEREAAAKKYNLLPEEYEPYHDESESAGDYPHLPFDSVDSKDPYYDWDDPKLRRNYMEPVHKSGKVLLPELLSTEPLKVSHEEGSIKFLQFVAVCLICFYFLDKYKIEVPHSAKQYPKPGVKHYTFELE